MAALSVTLRSPATTSAAGSRAAGPAKVSCVRSKVACSFPSVGASSSPARSVEPVRATATQAPPATHQSSSAVKTKVGINGFGRIGRLVLRIATSRVTLKLWLLMILLLMLNTWLICSSMILHMVHLKAP